MVPNLSTGTCAGTDDPRFFAGGNTAEGREAKGVCLSCPVLTECLNYALQVGVEGIWGGTDLEARKKIRTRLKIVAEPVLPPDLFPAIFELPPLAPVERGVCEITGVTALERCAGYDQGTTSCEPCAAWRRFRVKTRAREQVAV